MGSATTVTIDARYAGPPSMGHGGYMAGLFADRWPGAFRVTLRRPTPLDVPLQLDQSEPDRSTLTQGENLIAEAEPTTLDIDVPDPVSVDAARAAEAASPSRFNGGRGVHPTCFGCGLARAEGDGLRIAVGPVAGTDQLAAVWHPGEGFADDDGLVSAQMVTAALDCPGAFAFITNELPAGLLGRITVERFGPVAADAEHVLSAWRIGTDGKKLLAGTALHSAGGDLLAAATAVWFPFNR